MPLGQGYTVEAQWTGAEEFRGIQVLVFEPVPGKFPDQEPPKPEAQTQYHENVSWKPPQGASDNISTLHISIKVYNSSAQ